MKKYFPHLFWAVVSGIVLVIASQFLRCDFTAWDMPGHFMATQEASANFWPWLSGWSTKGFGGYPQGYFYPPFFYWLTCAIGRITSLEAAFRTVTLLSVAMLPVSAYVFLRALGFTRQQSRPGVAAFLIVMLLTESLGHSMGGTLGGTFRGGLVTAQLAYPLFFFYLAIIARGAKKPHLLPLASILLALIALTHGYIALTAYLASATMFFRLYIGRGWRRIFEYAFHVLGFLLISAVWLVPYLKYKRLFASGIFSNWGGIDGSYASMFLQFFALVLFLRMLKMKSTSMKNLLALALTSFMFYLFLREFQTPAMALFLDAPIQAHRFAVPVLSFGALILGTGAALVLRRYKVEMIFLVALVLSTWVGIPKLFPVKSRTMTTSIPFTKSRGLLFDAVEGEYFREGSPHLPLMFFNQAGFNISNGLFIESSRAAPYFMTTLTELNPNDRGAFVWFSELATRNVKALPLHLKALGVKWLLLDHELSPEFASRLNVIKHSEFVTKLNLDQKSTEIRKHYYEFNNDVVEFLKVPPSPVPLKEDWRSIEDYCWKNISSCDAVIIRTDSRPAEFTPPSPTDKASAEYVTSEKIAVNIESSEARWIHLKIPYFPHWKAYQNDKPIPLYHAAGNMMALKGQGQIELRFERPRWEIALYGLSIFSLAILFLLSFVLSNAKTDVQQANAMQ
jgi:hypothetical protein